MGATLDNLTIQIVFIDPPVTNPTDPTQDAIPGLDFYTVDPNTGGPMLRRQVAGFPILSAGADNLTEAAGGASADNILLQGPVRWLLDSTLALTNGRAKTATFDTSGTGNNLGVFDPTLVPDDSVPAPASASDAENDLLTATWTITGLEPAVSQTWRVSAQFIGEDLAVNTTTDVGTNAGATLYYKTLFDPLQLWWMYDVASSLSG